MLVEDKLSFIPQENFTVPGRVFKTLLLTSGQGPKKRGKDLKSRIEIGKLEKSGGPHWKG